MLGPRKTRAKIWFCDTHLGFVVRYCPCGQKLAKSNASTRCGDCTWRDTWAVKHAADPRHQMLYSAKHRAKTKSVPFEIGVADIIIPELCPILKTPLDKSGGQETYPSLDRIVPKLGYVPGNVWVISTKANSMKWDATYAELLAFARYWIQALAESA